MIEFVSVALSQVGYINKQSNKDLESNTANAKQGYNGYTKYGAWFGLNPGAWCAMFVSWCAFMAGCESSIVKTSWVPDYVEWFKAKGQWKTRSDDYSPSSGDLILFGSADHVGIVEDCINGIVYTIEGNANGGTVCRNRYLLSDSYIMGYCQTKLQSSGYPVVTLAKGTYKNGSTVEPVYADSALHVKIGELNKYEVCTKIGTCGNRTMVIYPVDDTNYYKIGFVEYGGS